LRQFLRTGQHGAVERAAHRDRRWRKSPPGRYNKRKAMPTAAVPGSLQIGAVAVRHHLADQLSARDDVEAHRHLGMVDMLRPSP